MPKVIRRPQLRCIGQAVGDCRVVYVNGLEEDRTEVDSVVLKEPVDQVVTVGTAEPIQVLSSSSGGSAAGSSGSFIWPVDGGACYLRD